MGTRSLIIAGLLTLFGGVAAKSELSLAPRLAEFEGEGMKFQHLVFSDGSGKEITFLQPRGWDYAGSSTKLVLRPKGSASAEATITRSPLAAPTAFDEEGCKRLVNEALATIPAGSTDIQVLGQDKNPVTIGLKETFMVTMSYVSNGERIGRSLMFMDRGKEQLRFQLISRLSDFNDLQKAFLHSAFTWNNL